MEGVEIESSDYYKQELKKLLIKLKDDCEEVTIIIQVGDNCCQQTGCICQVKDCFVVLNDTNNSCQRTYILLDCICTVSICEPEAEAQEFDQQQKTKDDEVHSTEKAAEEITAKAEAGTCQQVYGYGRKIKINFSNQSSTVAVDAVNMTELSLEVRADTADNFLQYFYKNEVDGNNIGLSVLPANEGNIESITCDQEASEAVITGAAPVYIDSTAQGSCEFELVITANTAKMEIEAEERIIARTEELTGVGEQIPFTIESGD